MAEAVETTSRRRPRRRLLALAGLVLVACATGYWHFWQARPVGSGPAGPAVPPSAFRRTWTDRKVVLLGLGDSVTEGWGASEGRCYFRRLVANPHDEFDDMKGICLSAVIPDLEARNLAVPSTTSLHHAEHIRALAKFPAEVLGIVVMTTGGNDIIHDYGRRAPREGAMYGATLEQAQPWIDAYRERLSGMIEMLRKRFPGGCHIFLANIYDPTDGRGDAENAFGLLSPVSLPPWPDCMRVLRAYNDIIADCANRHPDVHLVDMHGEFMGHGIHCTQFWRDTYRRRDPHYWYFYNLEDPNDRGYDAIRRLMLLEMIKVFRPGPAAGSSGD